MASSWGLGVGAPSITPWPPVSPPCYPIMAHRTTAKFPLG